MNKRFSLALALAVLIAFPLFARDLRYVQGDTLPSIDPPAGAPLTIGELTTRMRDRVQASVINVESSDSSFIIPIAGNAAGGNGTFFKSDASLANYRGAQQRVAIGWLQSGVDNSSAPLSYLNLPANTVVFFDDFVGTTLQKSGLGAVLVVGVDAAGNVDSSSNIDGFSRIWTPQPGSNGTVSQNFPAVSVNDSLGSLTAYVLGLKQNTQFRSNVGIVNLDSVAHTWTVRSVINGASVSFSVPANSVVQTGIAASSALPNGGVALAISTTGSGFWWSAYGTSTDNVTGDGWVARATQ